MVPITTVIACVITLLVSLVLPQNVAYPIIYGILLVMAVISVMILKNIHSRWSILSHNPEA